MSERMQAGICRCSINMCVHLCEEARHVALLSHHTQHRLELCQLALRAARRRSQPHKLQQDLLGAGVMHVQQPCGCAAVRTSSCDGHGSQPGLQRHPPCQLHRPCLSLSPTWAGRKSLLRLRRCNTRKKRLTYSDTLLWGGERGR